MLQHQLQVSRAGRRARTGHESRGGSGSEDAASIVSAQGSQGELRPLEVAGRGPVLPWPGPDAPALPSSSALLLSSSLSTACPAWTPTGSLAREATRRARSLSPTWNCSAKRASSWACPFWPGQERTGATPPLVSSVGDPAAQGGESYPTPSRPRASGCEGPQRLNDPGPSPSPASDLVPEPPQPACVPERPSLAGSC